MSKVRKGKTMNCKICGEEVHNCGVDAEKVTCWKCVNKMMSTGFTLAEEEEIEKELKSNNNL